MSACETPLLKYSAKEYFFKAALCRFCLSTDDARNAIERFVFYRLVNFLIPIFRYEGVFPTFIDTRECALLKELLEAAETENIDNYTDAVKK
jgi:alpha-soluble NSF attachment protein